MNSTDQQPAPPFNLPDDCLVLIFDKLPLEHLLAVNLVCRQWYRVQRSAFARRRKLLLIIGDPNDNPNGVVTTFNPNPLAYWHDECSLIRHSWIMRLANWSIHTFGVSSQFEYPPVHGLMDNFAIITSLEVIVTDVPVEVLDHVNRLLKFWSKTLVSLKLWLNLTNSNHGRDAKSQLYLNRSTLQILQFRLIDAINSCTKLTHLTLQVHVGYFTCGMSLSRWDYHDEALNLTIQLDSLEEFNYDTNGFSASDFEAIFLYAESHPNLRSIRFGHSFQSEEQANVLLSCNRKVAQKVTELSLDDFVTESLLARICDHFSRLTTLWLVELHFPRAQWTKALAQCPFLEQLKLSFSISEQCPNVPKEQISQLKSIKKLSLSFHCHSHLDFETLQLTWIFPNLEMIDFDDDDLDCTICVAQSSLDNLDSSHSNLPQEEENRKRKDECRKRLFSPLKNLKNVWLIKCNSCPYGNVLYSKEDL